MSNPNLKLIDNSFKKERLTKQLTALKQGLIFAANTAYSPKDYKGGSHGHCAVVAIIVQYCFSGDIVTAQVEGERHFFNQIGDLQVDITGDQFGLPSVQVEKELYKGTIKRVQSKEFSEDMMRRVQTLIKTSLRGIFSEI